MSTWSSFGMQRTKTISITSGKGGVGKTTLLANIAYGLAQRGKKVLILDGDLGMANVDIVFGVRSQGSLYDIISGRKEMKDILLPVGKDIHLIPGGSGVVEYNDLNHFERRALVEAVSALPQGYDYLLVDTAPGIADNVLFLNAAAQVVSVVITPEPASFADAYALIKVLHQQKRLNKFSIICNEVKDEQAGKELFKRFNDVVQRFLYVGLDYWGSVPLDSHLKNATQMQRLVLKQNPQSESAISLRQIVQQIDGKTQQFAGMGGMQGFWEQVVGIN